MARRLDSRDLLKAACTGDVKEVMKLVGNSRVSRFNVRNSYGHTVLHQAVESGRVVAVKTLVRAGADINCLNEHNKTPLMVAVERDRLSCIRELLKLGADIHDVDNEGRNAFMWAAIAGRNDCLKRLIKEGTGINSVDHSGRNALMWAAINGKTESLQLLIGAGVDLHCVDQRGKNAFMHAAENRQRDCVNLLIEAVVDIQCEDGRGEVSLSDVIDQQDSSGMTALAYAVSSGSHDTVSLLIDYGASVNIRDCSGKTLLHYLMHLNDSDFHAAQCLQILLSKELDVNAADNDGMTPLMYVAQRCFSGKRTIARLFEHGAKINLEDNQEQTMLIHYLTYNQHTYIKEQKFRFLLDKGAMITVGKFAIGTLAKLAFDIDLTKINLNLDLPWKDFEFVVEEGKRKLLMFLVISGVYPSRISWSHIDLCNSKSMLKVSVKLRKCDITNYFIAICYLGSADLSYAQQYPVLSNQSGTDLPVHNIIEKLHSQPWPLVKLCFVAVSTAFGASPGRQERVKNSQLPPKLQNMLLFGEPWSRLCVHQWDKIPLTFSPEEYENLPQPRPLLYHWPVGRALTLCDCGKCDGTMYKYKLEDNEERENVVGKGRKV